MKSGKFNAATWLLRHEPGRLALRERDLAVTYGELTERVRRVAAGLQADGVRPEERVVLVMCDGVAFVEAFLGAMWMGAIPVPVNPLLPERDVAPIVAHARARLVIRDVAPSAAPSGEPFDSSYESPGFWLCTSGTTGTPKLAMHRHADARTVAEGYAREVLDIVPGDVCYSVAPIFHAYGLGNSLFFPLSVGACAVLEPTRPPTPMLVGDIVRTQRPALFFCVPTFYAALLASNLPEDTFASVRIAVSAGEALPAELFARFKERFGVEILDGIGSTEMTHIFVSNRKGTARGGTSGTVVGGSDVKVTDDDGRDVDAGAPGHLWVRGDTAATGYWCRSEVTRRTFQGDWVRTGDVYVRDELGTCTYLGRSDDMFKVAGEWVSPVEVESVLIENPGVLEAAVVGIPDENGLVKPVAFVVGTADVTVLIEHCRARLAGFKRPRRFTFVDDLPKTVTGKIQRFRLRASG